MRLKSLLHTLTGLSLLGLMCLGAAVQAALDPDAIGKVLMIQGKVLAYSEAGDQRVLRSNAAVYEGDTIETIGEGAVVVTLADGTQWDIFDTSKLSIVEYVFTPEGSSQDSANYKFHEGQVTYTSGKLGERGAEVAIEMDDQTVYPEGTIISFLFRSFVKVVNVVQGKGRVKTKVRQTTTAQTTTMTAGQFAVSSAAAVSTTTTQQTSQVTVVNSAAAAIIVIQQVITQTVTSGFVPRTAPVAAAPSSFAQAVVTNIETASQTAASRSTVVTKTKTKTKTTQVIATDGTGSGGSGHEPGLLPATTTTSNLFVVVDPNTGTTTNNLVQVDTNTGTKTPVSPNQ